MASKSHSIRDRLTITQIAKRVKGVPKRGIVKALSSYRDKAMPPKGKNNERQR